MPRLSMLEGCCCAGCTGRPVDTTSVSGAWELAAQPRHICRAATASTTTPAAAPAAPPINATLLLDPPSSFDPSSALLGSILEPGFLGSAGSELVSEEPKVLPAVCCMLRTAPDATTAGMSM
eukprot:2262524-Rhodomonas_salina.2